MSKVSQVAVVALAAALAGCAATNEAGPPVVRVIAHDSFVVADDVLADFKKRTGLEVQIITAGDAGTLVGNAVLNRGQVGADVLFGIDDTLLPRALDAEVFQPHQVDVSALEQQGQGSANRGLSNRLKADTHNGGGHRPRPKSGWHQRHSTNQCCHWPGSSQNQKNGRYKN